MARTQGFWRDRFPKGGVARCLWLHNWVLALVLLIPALGWSAEGVIRENRTVAPFHAVELRGVGEVILTPGKEAGLIVESLKQWMAYIRTETRNGVLILHIDPEINRLNPPFSPAVRYLITSPPLDALTLWGAGSMRGRGFQGSGLRLAAGGTGRFDLQGVDANYLEVTLNGSATCQFQGNVERQTVTINGTGTYLGRGLIGKWVQVIISGSGRAEVHATEALSATVYGTGLVTYAGNPKKVHPSIFGVGVVRPAR